MSIIAPRSSDAFFKEETPRIKKHKGLNRMSKKRKYESRQYTKLRKAFLEENPICMMKVQCEGGTATEVHHTKYRGKHYLDVSTWLGSCFYCHRAVHARPNEARKLGLLAFTLPELLFMVCIVLVFLLFGFAAVHFILKFW